MYDRGELIAATVEPYPTMHSTRDQPATVQLVEPTSTCCSSIVGRLYRDDEGSNEYNRCILSHGQRWLAALLIPAYNLPDERLQRWLQQLPLHPELRLGTVFEQLKRTPCSVKTANWMWSISAGVTHCGKGYGDSDETRNSNLCIMCQQKRDSIQHIVTECDALLPIREWTRRMTQWLEYFRNGYNCLS